MINPKHSIFLIDLSFIVLKLKRYIMSDNEANEEKPLKVKKERTEAQKDATRRMLEKRVEIDAIKRGHKNALKTEKELKLKDKVKKIKEVETKMSNYKTDDDEESEEEVVNKSH